MGISLANSVGDDRRVERPDQHVESLRGHCASRPDQDNAAVGKSDASLLKAVARKWRTLWSAPHEETNQERRRREENLALGCGVHLLRAFGEADSVRLMIKAEWGHFCTQPMIRVKLGLPIPSR